MNEEMVIKIEQRVIYLIESLDNLEPNSEEYNSTVTMINKLYETINKEKELALKDKNLAIEEAEKHENRKIKSKEVKTGAVLSGLKTVVELSAVVVPVIFYGVWMKKGFEFEENGTITSGTFKGLVSKFKTTR